MNKNEQLIGTCPNCNTKNVELFTCWLINYAETPCCDGCCEWAINDADSRA